MKYRYEISQEDIANFRNTTLDEEFDVLDPDGFVAEEEIGDAIMEEYGWDMTKEKVMKYDYSNISSQGRSWIDDLHRHDTGFPAVDLANMSAEDRDTLANYLRADDGSLSASDQKFSKEVAVEIESLQQEQDEE